jgi:hypothetical protein
MGYDCGVCVQSFRMMPVYAKKKGLAGRTRIWGARGAGGMIVAMPVNGALIMGHRVCEQP